MKILWVQAGRFLPMDAGGRIRSTQTIRALNAEHEVTVVSCYRSRHRDPAYEAELSASFPGAISIWMGRDLRSGLRHRIPGRFVGALAVELTAPKWVRRQVAAIAREGRHDIVLADFVFAAPFLPRRGTAANVVFSHNVEYRSFETFTPPPWNLPLWLAMKSATVRVRRFERKHLRLAAHTFATSDQEVQMFRALARRANVSSVGTGVDLSEFAATPLPAGDDPKVVYTGNMSYFPNIEAMEWFCREVWPRVVTRHPEARLQIVGKEPTTSVRALASATVEVTGWVESVAPYLAGASVVVLPILSGSGTRLKVFEAMASGRPIVATTFAPEGLGVTDGHDMVLVDDPERFADEILRFLQDRPRAEAFGRAAAETASRHTWAAVAERMEAVLEGLLGERD
jgi:glycosyltransferase involved in cell wall biosynthesis